tara:strand:- start:3196 stop:3507 length:312 start_codon:yes stop_codon:yes gene_type:complete
MKKFIVLFLIFFLIISTPLVKNSTKDIDYEIYLIEENLLFLNKRFNDSKLEFDYLSSSEKLLEYQKLYFENLLKKKSIEEMKIMNISQGKIFISDLSILNKDE